jgi:hypothetical protein
MLSTFMIPLEFLIFFLILGELISLRLHSIFTLLCSRMQQQQANSNLAAITRFSSCPGET